MEVPRRRQGRSCDQCRKGKRACDLAVFDIPPDALQKARVPAKDPPSIRVFGPCSNCRRWRKQCTFEWLASNARQKATKEAKKLKEQRAKGEPQSMVDQTCAAEVDLPAATFSNDDFSIQVTYPTSSNVYDVLPTLDQSCQWLNEPLTMDGEGLIINKYTRKSSQQSENEPHQDSVICTHRSTSDALTVASAHVAQGKLLTLETLAQRHTRTMVTRDLLRIYHDSLENTLTCVLTERTCPYSDFFAIQNPPHLFLGPQWAVKWSNRMCGRICRLDRAYAAVRGRSLTATEERAVSKALHTTIMAFAMQWRKGRPRLQGRDDATPNCARSSGPSTEISRSMLTTYWNEACQALQACGNIESMRLIFAYMLFSVINRPLDEETYKRVHQPSVETFSSENEFSSLPSEGSITEQLSRVFDLEEAPLFLETGIRRLLLCRYKIKQMQRVEIARRIAQSTSLQCMPQGQHSSSSGGEIERPALGPQERETFNLLYWLGVIIDTMAAAVYGRPVVISDEDSSVSLDMASPSESSLTMAVAAGVSGKNGSLTIWQDLFLRSGSLSSVQQEPLWPCTFEKAAAIICDASPVKLLLYRRITRLQSLLYRGCLPEQLEEIIEESRRLLDFWDQTYGRFANELMLHHAELLPRLQSWYVIVVGHWQLAVILFAELIQEIDGARLGLEYHRQLREATAFATALKQKHATAASDIAGVCLRVNPMSLVNGDEFHELFRAGIILTEPWVNIFVRLFSKAGSVLLEGLVQQAEYMHANDAFIPTLLEDTRQRCIYCIEALRCLRKNCDTADVAAQTLAERLEQAL